MYILTSNKKVTIYVITKFVQFEDWIIWSGIWYILWRFQVREQSKKLNVLYHGALKTKVSPMISYLL